MPRLMVFAGGAAVTVKLMVPDTIVMAACIGVAHPKWGERPIVAVVKKPGAQVSRDELLALLPGQDGQAAQIPV